MRKKWSKIASLILSAAMAVSLTACGTGRTSSDTSATQDSTDTSESTDTASSTEDTSSSDGELTKVNFQLKWVPQAQFMGYYVAQEKGFYKDEGLDVNIMPGGSDINAPSVVESGQADIGTTNLYNIMSYQEQGYPLVTISQIMQKSPFVLVCRKDKIASVDDLKGKTIGIWTGGNDAPVRALLTKHNINPDTDAQLASQGTTIDGFLDGTFDAYSAMTYNELLLAYEAGYTDDDLYLIDMDEEGCGMLADCLFANSDWLKDNHDTAVKFVRASLKGWKYACQNLEEATQIAYDAMDQSSSTLEHQQKSAEELKKIIVPDDDYSVLGTINEDSVNTTIQIATDYQIITKPTDLNTIYDTSVMDDVGTID